MGLIKAKAFHKNFNPPSSFRDNVYCRTLSFCHPVFSLDFHTSLDHGTKRLLQNGNIISNVFLLHVKGRGRDIIKMYLLKNNIRWCVQRNAKIRALKFVLANLQHLQTHNVLSEIADCDVFFCFCFFWNIQVQQQKMGAVSFS